LDTAAEEIAALVQGFVGSARVGVIETPSARALRR
jgi:hypothetical protein